MSELINYSTGTTVPASWLNRTQLREEALASYVVYQAGGTVYAKSLSPGGLDYSGADAATQIQNAANALTTGGRIYIRTGTYTINTEIQLTQNNIRVIGEGSGTILQATSSLAVASEYAILQFGSTTANYSGLGAENMVLDGNLKAVTGLRFRTSGSNKTSDSYGRNILAKNCGRDAGILFGGQDNFLQDCIADTTTAQQAGTIAGIYTSAVTGVRSRIVNCVARNGVSNASGNAVGFQGDDQIQRITWDGCVAYANGGAGFSIVGSGANRFKNINIVNCKAFDNVNASALPRGFFFQYIDGLIVSGCQTIGNSNSGMLLDNCTEATVSNNLAKNNGQNTGPIGGIGNSNGSKNAFKGNICFDDQGTKTQSYGLFLDGGSADCIVEGNNVEGNNNAGIQVGAGTDHYIRNNKGFNPVAPSNVTAGASVWTYTNNDNYDEYMILNNLNGGTVSAISYRGDTGYPTTVNGFSFFLQPTQTIAVTWATTAPTFRKYPQ